MPVTVEQALFLQSLTDQHHFFLDGIERIEHGNLLLRFRFFVNGFVARVQRVQSSFTRWSV
jgi:hypothetical protein